MLAQFFLLSMRLIKTHVDVAFFITMLTYLSKENGVPGEKLMMNWILENQKFVNFELEIIRFLILMNLIFEEQVK